jgi:hypothetical protein
LARCKGERDYCQRLLKWRDQIPKQVPPGAVLLVASQGDDNLLNFGAIQGRHFPQTEDGMYGGTPADGEEAFRQLEAMRGKGATHLLIPAWMTWWLDFYETLRVHLEKTARLAAKDSDYLLYELVSSEALKIQA